jgi:hypothetical protein
MSTDPADLDTARTHATALAASAQHPREVAHATAVTAWAGGDWHGAARHLDDLLVQWPTDVLALLMGHQLDFFTGDAKNLRDRPARSLVALGDGHPHAGFVRGMQAFGLEEAGHYGPAEVTALAAVEQHPDDVWAIHAVAHTYEMQGRVDEGIRFMQSRVDDWGTGNLFTVHNWWHLGLYLLEAGLHDRVLAIYDAEVHHDGSAGVPIEMLDASAMLWRLLLDGVDTGDRFAVLADAWAASLDGATPWYAFNDVHATMAFVGAGRRHDALALISRLEAHVAERRPGSNHLMTEQVGLPIARAIVAFGDGRFDDAIGLLWPARGGFHRFGGSHAQRDAPERTLVEAAVRAGRHDLAERLLAERLALRPTGTFALDRLALVAAGPVAETAGRDAAAARARFAAAAG